MVKYLFILNLITGGFKPVEYNSCLMDYRRKTWVFPTNKECHFSILDFFQDWHINKQTKLSNNKKETSLPHIQCHKWSSWWKQIYLQVQGRLRPGPSCKPNRKKNTLNFSRTKLQTESTFFFLKPHSHTYNLSNKYR